MDTAPYCHSDEFEDAVLSIELVAEKIQIVRTAPTSWKWVVLALQNAVQAAMVLALAGTDGCGALYPRSQKQNRGWLSNPTPERPRVEMADSASAKLDVWSSHRAEPMNSATGTQTHRSRPGCLTFGGTTMAPALAR